MGQAEMIDQGSADGDRRAQERVGLLVADRFRLRRVVGRGAMGTVYLADQLPLNRQVAVKVLDPPAETEDAQRVRQRFMREASTLARLEHANIVRIYDFGQWKDVNYLVMEYVDGYSLRRLQSNGPIPPVRVVDIGLQICAALREAHSQGLIHRDLKPANILLTRQSGQLDVVKVVDFGLAKGFYGSDQDLTQVGQVLGTPMYMSPEQIRDDRCDPRSDIYSLGVVLYRSLTGETPFSKGATSQVLMAHLYEPPRPFAQVKPDLDVPPALEWVVMRCLEKEPEARFANVSELHKALKACRRALDNPAYRNVQLAMEDGCAVVPPEDPSESSRSIQVTKSSTIPNIMAQSQAFQAQYRVSGIGTIPTWALGLVFVGMIVAGVVAGIMAEKTLNAVDEAQYYGEPIVD